MITLLFAAAWKGTLLLGTAWVAASLLRKSSADLRHRIWLAALCGLPLLLLPVPVPEAARVDLAFTAEAVGAGSSASLWPAIWAVGAALSLARFAVGVARLAILTRGSRLTEIAGVHSSAAISTRLTWGVFRPVILLPDYARDWTEEHRAVAVAHERAHVERGDWFWQSYAQVVGAIFWFNPLVWLAAARLRREAEEAVDDAVIRSGAQAHGYAEQLLDVARHIKGGNHAAGIAMVRHPELSARIAAILDQTRVRTMAGVRSRVAIAVLAVCSVPVLAAFQVPTEPYPVGNGVSAPVPIYKPEPQYPQEGKDAHAEGAVGLSLVVDQNGVPLQVTVTQPLEPSLDAAAVAAIEKWRFTPGMKDGKPVPVRATIVVQFKLR